MDIKKSDKIDAVIDLLITMTVAELAAEDGRDASDVLTDFLSSKTAKMLYDEETKLWWDGPSAIAEQYRAELSRRQETVVL